MERVRGVVHASDRFEFHLSFGRWIAQLAGSHWPMNERYIIIMKPTSPVGHVFPHYCTCERVETIIEIAKLIGFVRWWLVE